MERNLIVTATATKTDGTNILPTNNSLQQGKTAEPGFIAHWTYPLRLGAEAKWLAYYVSLSRPRSFAAMLSHGLPSRDIIEGGAPAQILDALKNLFGNKIAATKVAFAKAREEIGWPMEFPWNASTS